MRNPSLHIRKTHLQHILNQVGIEVTDEQMTAVFSRSLPYQLKNRYIVKSNSAIKKAVEKVVESVGNVELFNRVLTACRMTANHKYVEHITKDHPQFPMLKEVAHLAQKFTELFNIGHDERGYTIFCDYGLILMRKQYGLNKFKYHYPKIVELYKNIMELSDDEDSDKTKLFKDCWEAIMLQRMPEIQLPKYTKDLTPEKYVNFLYGRKEAELMRVDYMTWIEAQFDGLEFTGSFPELTQLYGEPAKQRYQKQLSSKIRDKSEKVSVDSEHSEYFRMLKERKSKRNVNNDR